jgi:hypothetical protein
VRQRGRAIMAPRYRLAVWRERHGGAFEAGLTLAMRAAAGLRVKPLLTDIGQYDSECSTKSRRSDPSRGARRKHGKPVKTRCGSRHCER